MALFQRKEIEVRARRADHPGYVTQGETVFNVEPGDWLIRNNGKTHVMGNAAFQDRYRPVGQVANLLMGMTRERLSTSSSLVENFSVAADDSFVGTFRKRPLTVSAERMEHEGDITERATVHYLPGDWLVTVKDEVYMLKHEDFAKTYTPLDAEAQAMFQRQPGNTPAQIGPLVIAP